MRFLAVPLALLLAFSAVAHAADLGPMPTKAPPVEAPPPVIEPVGWALLLIPIGLVVACVTEICKEEHPQPHSP
jgi:hypothetical protein